MIGNGATVGMRGLAAIESDLYKATEAFADANARLQEAERDRNSALETIDRHQTEFDEAIAQLRQRSTPGSKWRLEIDQNEGTGDAQADSEVSDATVLNGSSLRAVAAEFQRLRTHVQEQDVSPVVKIRV